MTVSSGKWRDREGTCGNRNAAIRKVLGKHLKTLRVTHSQRRGRGFESLHFHRMGFSWPTLSRRIGNGF
jgi:hypothetical protein